MTTLDYATPSAALASTPARRRPSLLNVYMQLSKARLTLMVLITTAVGYMLAPWVNIDPTGDTRSPWGTWSTQSNHAVLSGGLPDLITGSWMGLLWTVVGTGFLAAGASAFNQLMEIDRDGLMERTKRRPLPTGRISPLHGLVFGMACIIIGAGVLVERSTPMAAALGLLNVVLYAFVYTPLKTRTTLNTLVGAIVGALPPMMGWAGASGSLSAGAYLLGAILFVWQIPHFLALAWMYRAEYAKGGYRMLPVVEKDGRLTCLLVVIYSMALLAVGPAAMVLGVTGWISAIFSMVLGSVMVAAALNLSRNKTRENARKLFFASIIYLPLLLIMMVADSSESGKLTALRSTQTTDQAQR